jgi:orotate phosphoribosyltransferase
MCNPHLAKSHLKAYSVIMQDIMSALAETGALITGSHIVYTSGRHGADYINKDALYLHPTVTEQMCARMAQNYDPAAVDVVAGPTVGGVILAQWVAWHLTQQRRAAGHTAGDVLAVYAEEEAETKRRVFRRGYDAQVRGRRVVVVEDIVTTGGSAQKVIDAVRELGGIVVGLSIICNRSGKDGADLFDVPVHSLTTVAMESWAAEDCPLCARGVPINTSVGKGKDFVAHQRRETQ